MAFSLPLPSLQRGCPVCARMDGKVLGGLEKNLPPILSRHYFSLVECQGCATAYINPLPIPSDFSMMYERNTQFDIENEQPGKADGVVAYYANRLKELLEIAPPQIAPVTLLEVGAGPAWLSRAAKSLDPSIYTVAQDISSECATRAPWADLYYVGPVGKMLRGSLTCYHLISMTHVIGRLPDPLATLKELAPSLRQDGVMYVTAAHRPEGWEQDRSIERWKNWSYNHVPAHLQYFSKQALENLAQQANMKVISWTLHENGQSFEAMLQKEPPRKRTWLGKTR